MSQMSQTMNYAPKNPLKRRYGGISGALRTNYQNKKARTAAAKKVAKPTIASVVRSVLNRSAEMKTASITVNHQIVGAIAANTDVQSIFPAISQTPSEYNSRIGNKIKVFSVTVKGYINIQGVSNTFDVAKYLVRLMILAQKNKANYIDTMAAFNYAQLMVDSTDFDGTVSEVTKPLNEDAFAVKMDMLKYLSTFWVPGTTTSGIAAESTNSLVEFSYTFSFPKGRLVTYADDTAVNPNNWPYFLVAGFTHPGGATSSNGVIVLYTSTVKYTDV